MKNMYSGMATSTETDEFRLKDTRKNMYETAI